MFSLHVGTLGSLRARCLLWHCRCWVFRNRAKAPSALATRPKSSHLRVQYRGRAGLGWWEDFTSRGNQPPRFNDPLFGRFIVCFTGKAVIPWHLKQYDDREGTPTKQMFLAPPCCLPTTLKENKANSLSSQQVVEVTYIKLGIKVKTAEGESGRLGGWRA